MVQGRSGATFLVGLAQALRAVGLAVIEYAGWQTRARGSGGYTGNAPLCVMWHHTASNPSSDGQADADYCAVFAADAPLANLYIQRDGTVWVLAAGATNTNGQGNSMNFSRGTVPKDSMNANAVGIEVANNGIGEYWPEVQINTFFAASNAVNAMVGNRMDDICTHNVYAPSRKIDPATAQAVQGQWRPRGTNSSGTWNLDDIKAECIARADNALPPTPEPEVDEMAWTVLTVVEANATFMGWESGGLMPQVEWVNGDNPSQLARLHAYEENAYTNDLRLSIADLKNVALIGPLPSGDGRHDWTANDFGNVIP